MTQPAPEPSVRGPQAVFATTHWSAVQAAGDSDSPEARAALSELCTTYWYPLYAYVRRQGYDEHQAKDLTQEFFARLLARNYFKSLSRERGRFRSWLLASMEHFLAKEWRDANRLKRGGGVTMVSLDDEQAEDRYRREPVENMTAAILYEKRWALTLLERTFRKIRDEFAAGGKTALFERLQGFLSGEKGLEPYAKVAADLDMTEGAVRVAVHRLRQRYGEALREEIAHTVGRPEDVDSELNHLLAALTR